MAQKSKKDPWQVSIFDRTGVPQRRQINPLPRTTQKLQWKLDQGKNETQKQKCIQHNQLQFGL
jgi:hypothetical protein